MTLEINGQQTIKPQRQDNYGRRGTMIAIDIRTPEDEHPLTFWTQSRRFSRQQSTIEEGTRKKLHGSGRKRNRNEAGESIKNTTISGRKRGKEHGQWEMRKGEFIAEDS